MGNRTPEHAGSITDGKGFIHRMYGSEIRLANTEVHEITGNVYHPPLRRKIYDESLPIISSTNDVSKSDLSSFLILTWKDLKATTTEFDNF